MSKYTKGSIVLFLISLGTWFINKDLAFFLLVFLAISLLAEAQNIRESFTRMVEVLEKKGIAEWWEFIPDKDLREVFEESQEIRYPPADVKRLEEIRKRMRKKK